MIPARATQTAPALDFALRYRMAAAAALAVLGAVTLRTAWMCDDAFISMRTVASFVNGNGLRWNPDERVQAFTHPLWVLLLSGPYAITREPYFTVLAISVLCSMAAVALLAFWISRSGWNACVAVILLLFSRAFVDFSTSGLENPLSYLLVALVLFWVWRSPADLPAASLAGGLLLVNRLDLAVLVAPIVFFTAHGGPSKLLRNAALFAAPAAAWTAFSVLYYGFPFPNTAYAKLSTAIPRDELHRQGLTYLTESFSSDPLTLATIAAAIVVGILRAPARPAALGLIGYLAYVVSIGGDFMSGRFFSVPLFVSAAAIGRHVPLSGVWRAPVVAAAAVALGLAGSTPAPILSDGSYSRTDVPPHGIADERGVYYAVTGLLRDGHEWQPPEVDLQEKYRFAIERWRRAITSDFIGIQGYLAGDRINIIDFLALSDPLLARLPAERPWRVGHYRRSLPAGYFDSVRFNENRIVDPDLRSYYEELRTITRGPIWSRSRFRSILLLNTGRFEPLIDAYVSRMGAGPGE